MTVLCIGNNKELLLLLLLLPLLLFQRTPFSYHSSCKFCTVLQLLFLLFISPWGLMKKVLCFLFFRGCFEEGLFVCFREHARYLLQRFCVGESDQMSCVYVIRPELYTNMHVQESLGTLSLVRLVRRSRLLLWSILGSVFQVHWLKACSLLQLCADASFCLPVKRAREFVFVFWNTLGDPTDKLLAITPSQGLVAEDMADLSPAHQQVEPKTLV